MALETIIQQEEESKPVLVDVPVEVVKQTVSKTEEEEKKSVFDNIPRKWVISGIGGFILILVLALYLLARYLTERPDLTLKAPSTKPTITATPSAVVVASVSGNLASLPYVNSDDGYEITPPEDWVIDESKKTNSSVVFLSPIPKDINGRGFATSISVETSPAENIELAQQVDTIKNGLKEAFPDFSIEDDIQVYLQGRPFYLLGGTYTVDGVNLRKRTLIGIYKNKGYAISGSGPVVSWSDYESVISASMFSFRLL